MKVALLQLDIEWEDKNKNFDRVESFVERMRDDKPDLVVLPELFSTGYTMNSKPLAENLNDETTSFLSRLARNNKINVLGSFIEKTESKPKNSAILFDKNGKMLLHYSKIHLPSFLEENKNYTHGNKISTCEFNGQKIGIFICYDLRFPEIFRRIAEDTKCIFVIANWPHERIEHWDSLLKARAIENQLYIVGVNRVGKSPSSNYSGHSIIIDPLGNVVTNSKENEEGVFIGEIDFSFVEKVRSKFPFLKDRISPNSLTYNK